MSRTYSELYCDESYTQDSLFFGALQCSAFQAKTLREGLQIVREQYDMRAEMKWDKVSRAKLPAYLAFAQVFLNEPNSRFIVMEVKRDKTWTQWAPNEETRFFKSYYCFIRRCINPIYYKYNICIDYKTGKWYRTSSLQFAINNGIKRDYEFSRPKHPVHIHMENSKKDDLLQLVDVLLGAMRRAITTSATSLGEVLTESVSVQKQHENIQISPSDQFAQYIFQGSRSLTQRSQKNKFTLIRWTPQSKVKV